MRDRENIGMNTSLLARSILAVSTCAGLLAGCSGAASVPAGAGSGASAGINAKGQRPNISVMRTGMVVQHLDRRPSHIDNAAKSKTLLYVSDVGTGSVQIFEYPKGRTSERSRDSAIRRACVRIHPAMSTLRTAARIRFSNTRTAGRRQLRY